MEKRHSTTAGKISSGKNIFSTKKCTRASHFFFQCTL
jgi:hypothetical protein